MRLITVTALTAVLSFPLVPTGALSPAAAAANGAPGWGTAREVTLPAGTVIPVTFDTSVGSDISRIEQTVRGHVTRPVVVNGVTVIPRGSQMTGVVTSARRSGKVKGRAFVAVRFTEVAASGDRYPIASNTISRTAPATKKDDALKIGLPAAGGAAVGALIGGKKGAAIGATAGGGAGTAAVLTTRGKEVRFAKGAVASVRLTRPITVTVPR